MKVKLKKEKGITLIALVITIIVLLILAGVSIAMLTGQNGILTQASNSKEATTQAQVEEMVSLAIGSLQTENLGDTSKITPQMVADQVNEENNRTDVTAEGSSFPTNIVFATEGRKVAVDINLKVGSGTEDEELPLYSVEVEESEIAPQEIFNIETEDGKTASITDSSMPTKTAKITGIKSEYCNHFPGEEQDTNYEINYNGTKITDKLVVPYKVEVDGEWYMVTEVSLKVEWRHTDETWSRTSSLPKVNTIIYPNTVNRIFYDETTAGLPASGGPHSIVLPQNITEIPDNMFLSGNENLATIEIPAKVTKIGMQAFAFCNAIKEIRIPNTVTEMGAVVFSGWTEEQTIYVQFKEDDLPEGWDSNWLGYNCQANVVYAGE